MTFAIPSCWLVMIALVLELVKKEAKNKAKTRPKQGQNKAKKGQNKALLFVFQRHAENPGTFVCAGEVPELVFVPGESELGAERGFFGKLDG